MLQDKKKTYRGRIGEFYYQGITITHLLLYFYPNILESSEDWVDMLITSEEDVKESDGEKCFLYLLKSKRLDSLDFSCHRFKKLL